MTITASNDQTRARQIRKTGLRGLYVFPLLPPGTYTLSAESAGFSTAVRGSVTVRISNVTQLPGLTAGVVTDPPNAGQVGFGTQNPSVNGSRRGSNNYLLDGNVNNNPMNHDALGVSIPSVDFIQEFNDQVVARPKRAKILGTRL